MFLEKDIFKTVVASTPLVSIDLIVENENVEYLLGKRTNRPAQGYWFVPGGRIQKNESMDAAFERLCLDELGLKAERAGAQFLGSYEHFYQDSVFGDKTSTHYVVLAYKLFVNITNLALTTDQHSDYSWVSSNKIIHDEQVHKHTKWYFCNTL